MRSSPRRTEGQRQIVSRAVSYTHLDVYKRQVFEQAEKFALTYSAYAVRDFFFIIQPRHGEVVTGIASRFMNTGWNEFFKFLPPAFLFSRGDPRNDE